MTYSKYDSPSLNIDDLVKEANDTENGLAIALHKKMSEYTVRLVDNSFKVGYEQGLHDAFGECDCDD